MDIRLLVEVTLSEDCFYPAYVEDVQDNGLVLSFINHWRPSESYPFSCIRLPPAKDIENSKFSRAQIVEVRLRVPNKTEIHYWRRGWIKSNLFGVYRISYSSGSSEFVRSSSLRRFNKSPAVDSKTFKKVDVKLSEKFHDIIGKPRINNELVELLKADSCIFVPEKGSLRIIRKSEEYSFLSDHLESYLSKYLGNFQKNVNEKPFRILSSETDSFEVLNFPTDYTDSVKSLKYNSDETRDSEASVKNLESVYEPPKHHIREEFMTIFTMGAQHSSTGELFQRKDESRIFQNALNISATNESANVLENSTDDYETADSTLDENLCCLGENEKLQTDVDSFSFVEEFEVAEHLMGLAIGKNGQNISAARKLAGVEKIDLIKNTCRFKIRGTSENAVKAARRKLEFFEESIVLNPKCTKVSVADNGKVIKDLTKKTGLVQISVETKKKGSSQAGCVLSLVGHLDCISDAKAYTEYLSYVVEKKDCVGMMNKLSFEETFSRFLNSEKDDDKITQYTKYVSVKKHLMGLAVGKNGANIKAAQKLDGITRIHTLHNKPIFVISGTKKSALETAAKMLKPNSSVLPNTD